MDIDDILPFLPIYPSIDVGEMIEAGDPYASIPFNTVIFRKEEFQENRLDPIEEIPTKRGDLLKHQITISRFLSSYTPYDRLLITAKVGTGKTCSVIGVIETIRRETKLFTGAIIIAKSDRMLDNFQNELMFKCTGGQYIPEDYDRVSKATRVRRANKLVGEFYTMITMELFAKQLSKESDTGIQNRYSNKIIVIDEIHNIRQHDREISLNLYYQYSRLTRLVKNTKIILMSGTPMKDSVTEIADVMNLLLPVDYQLPTNDDFVKRYFHKKHIQRIDELKQYFKGRVSYLKAMKDPNVILREVGESRQPLTNFKVVVDTMSDFQTRAYATAISSEKTDLTKKVQDDVMFLDSRQSSLFVFPDGSWGSAGFKKYITKSAAGNYALTPAFKDMLIGRTDDERLQSISQYSSKYSQVIANILSPQQQGKCRLIYCNLVTGSGLILFSKLLELFKYKQAVGNETTRDKRYMIMTSETGDKFNTLMNRFNNVDNISGEYIQLILGSKASSEGFTFKHIQAIDILTPHWNYAETEQAIARGYRLGSHSDFVKASFPIYVDVYHRVSIPNQDDLVSIDLYMYEVAETKDIMIKQIEQALLESSFDCALNYDRNVSKSLLDGTRECNYTSCKVRCDGCAECSKNIPIPNIDFSTFDIYYATKHIYEIEKIVTRLFSHRFSIQYDEIKEAVMGVGNGRYDEYQIIETLHNMISTNMEIMNRFGFPLYLREENNTYFLSLYLIGSVTIDALFYTSNLITTYLMNFDDIFAIQYAIIIPKLIEKACANPVEMMSLAASKFTHETIDELIDVAIIYKNSEQYDVNSTKGELAKAVLCRFSSVITDIEDKVVNAYLHEIDNDFPIKCFDKKTKMWTDCPPEQEAENIRRFVELEKAMTKDNPYGIYGKQSREYCGESEVSNDKERSFCLVPTDQETKGKKKTGRTVVSGQVCGTGAKIKKNDLIKLAFETLDIPISEEVIQNKIGATTAYKQGMLSGKSEIKLLQTLLTKAKVSTMLPDNLPDLRRLYFFTLCPSRRNKKDNEPSICEYIDRFLVAKKLVITDPTCGNPFKKNLQRIEIE